MNVSRQFQLTNQTVLLIEYMPGSSQMLYNFSHSCIQYFHTTYLTMLHQSLIDIKHSWVIPYVYYTVGIQTDNVCLFLAQSHNYIQGCQWHVCKKIENENPFMHDFSQSFALGADQTATLWLKRAPKKLPIVSRTGGQGRQLLSTDCPTSWYWPWLEKCY